MPLGVAPGRGLLSVSKSVEAWKPVRVTVIPLQVLPCPWWTGREAEAEAEAWGLPKPLSSLVPGSTYIKLSISLEEGSRNHTRFQPRKTWTLLYYVRKQH